MCTQSTSKTTDFVYVCDLKGLHVNTNDVCMYKNGVACTHTYTHTHTHTHTHPGEVVSAVDNKVDVFIDGGIRKGTDILKALALGAKAVFIGWSDLMDTKKIFSGIA